VLVRLRLLTIVVAAFVIVAAGCSSSDGDIEALENRIAELEASTTTATSATTTSQPPTTTSPATTAPQPPTTTTTVPAFDLAAFDFDSLVSWMEADSIDSGFFRFAISSCENSVDSLGKLARVYGLELVLTVGSLIEVRDGNASLIEADARFSRFQEVAPYAAAAALAIADTPEIGRATSYASLVGDTIQGSSLSIISFPFFVYDVDEGTIDWDAFELWGGGLVKATEELENLGARSWADYCS